MKSGVAYITISEGKVYFSLQQDRNSEPVMMCAAAQSEEEALHAALNFVQEQAVPLDKAVLAIDSRTCFLRNYQLPIQNKKQLMQVVDYELEDDLPLNVQDVVTDSFKGGGSGGVSYVMAAAIHRDRVEKLIDMFNAQGVELEAIDLDVAAFARACMNPVFDYERCVGLEIGQDRTLFCSLSHGKVLSLAVIDLGENDLIERFASEHGLTAEEVDRVMVLDDGAAASEGVRDSFNAHLEKFLGKIMREVYRLLGEGEWPTHFIVSGDIVRVRKLRKTFEAISECNLQIWEELCLKLGEEVDEGVRGSSLAIGYGATERGGMAFDFRKGEYALRGNSAWRREIAYFISLLLLVGLSWFGYSYTALLSGERELAYFNAATLQVYKEAMPDVSQDLSPVQYESVLSSRLNVMTGGPLDESGVSVIETLRIVSSVLSRKINVEFVGLNLDSKKVDIQGEAGTMNEVDNVRNALNTAKAFKSVKVKSVVADKRTKRIRFEIEVVR